MTPARPPGRQKNPFFCKKNSTMQKRPFFLLSILSMIALLLIGRWMDQEIKDAAVATPPGFKKSIMALEFAQDTAMIYTVFKLPQPDSIRIQKTERLIRSIRLDYGYILAYALFMILFAVQCKRMGAARTLLAVSLTLIAAIGDVMENEQLIKIFHQVAIGGDDFAGIFDRLRFWMALKFFSIGAFFLVLSPFFWRSNVLGKIVGIAAVITMICWVLACFYRAEFWADALFSMIFLLFAGALIFGLTYKIRPKLN
jgi:hypothetical protein